MAEVGEYLAAEWWNGWWQQGWSWAALAGKPVGQGRTVVHGGRHGEQTLQQYWRRDPRSGEMRSDEALEEAGELIRDPDDHLWHLAHVPFGWRNGDSAKSAWGAERIALLAELVAARVDAAVETSVDVNCNATGPDGRAQFAGAVLLAAPRRSVAGDEPLHLDCAWARLPPWPNGKRRFGAGFRFRNGFSDTPEGANFDGATFSGNVDFDSATFSGNASFNRATFSGDAGFGGARFPGYAHFDGAAFSGHAAFNHATFSGDARFHSATFSRGAIFDHATFSGYAGFRGASFSAYASFDGATFPGYAGFEHAAFSEGAGFNRAIFFGEARFARATFSGYAGFDRATFSGYANFDSAAFSGDARFEDAVWRLSADFDTATFAGIARFAGSEFCGFVSFAGAAFAKAVTFESAGLGMPAAIADQPSGALFHRCTFAGPARFHGAQFPSFTDFTAATFVRQAWFTEVTWPKAAADWHAAFDQAVFRDVASFRGSGFRSFAAFDGASFGGGLQFDDTEEAKANERFREELAAARAPPSAEQEVRLKQLERGCRVLKQAMDKASHKTREQIFHAFELTARRHQGSTPWWERGFAWAYEAVADYGRSIMRPLGALLAGIPLFALAYWLMAGIDCSGAAFQALNYSFSRVLPFGAWAVKDSAWEVALLGNADTLKTVLVRLLATIQSILAAILVFLSLLAVRRRFQIT